LSGPDFDAVVIGAGPAGSLAALGLARRQRRVLLVDRATFPRPKVCGCCLNASALATLDAAGLGSMVERLGAPPLQRLSMVWRGKRAEVPLPPGVSLSRAVMDRALVEAATAAGVEFRDQTGGRVLPNSGECGERRVKLDTAGPVRAKIVVVADGLGGTSLRGVPGFEVQAKQATKRGLGGSTSHALDVPGIPRGAIVMACGTAGYLGAVRLEGGRIDFAAAVNAEAIKQHGGVAETAHAIAIEAGVADDWPLHRVTNWRATPGLTRARRRVAGPGLFVVGDAAGYVEPFTGEGMAWALAGGAAVVPIAEAAIDGVAASQAEAWTRTYRDVVRRRQMGCRLVAATLRRPRLTGAVVRTLHACPWLASPLVRRIARPHPQPRTSQISIPPLPGAGAGAGAT
jgi:flavin-dependent dehydrogenase